MDPDHSFVSGLEDPTGHGIPLPVLADPPLEEGDGTQSLKKRYMRNKMDPTSTCVDSALETLVRCGEHHWTPIRVGLDLFRTFLTVIQQGVPPQFRDLLIGIEDAFEKTGWEIEDAIEEGDDEMMCAWMLCGQLAGKDLSFQEGNQRSL